MVFASQFDERRQRLHVDAFERGRRERSGSEHRDDVTAVLADHCHGDIEGERGPERFEHELQQVGGAEDAILRSIIG